MTERITGIDLVDRKLEDLVVLCMARDHKISTPVELSAVKCEGNGDIAVLAFIGFKPTRTFVGGKELISVYLCDLKHSQTSGRLLLDRNVFASVVLAPLGRDSTPEGLLLFILKPTVSIDENNGETLTLTIQTQNQLAVVGRSKYFARCGAVKKNVGENGEEVLCKIPIDSSRCAHCTYHTNNTNKAANNVVVDSSVGSKRALDSASEPMNKRLQVNNFVTATAKNDRDASLTKQDDDDVAFSLRKHGSAVQSILGAAYTLDSRKATIGGNGNTAMLNTGSAAHILKKADPLELRVAQRIISTMAAHNNTMANNKSHTMATGGSQLPPHSAGSAAAAPGKLMARPVSALTQRVENQLLARSGTQSAIQSYGRPSTAPAPAHNSIQSCGDGSGVNSRQAATAPGPYKLVGDTLVNSAILLRNVANIKAPPSSAPTQSYRGASSSIQLGIRTGQSQDSFQQLLSGVVPSNLGSAYAPRNTVGVTSASATSASTTAGAAATAAEAIKNSKSRLDAEIDALLGRTSTHASEADADWAQGFGQRMDVLAKREFAQTKAAEVHSIEISAFKCQQCESRLTEQFPALCQNNGHNIHKVKAVKRFFECGQCAKREYSLSDRKDLKTKVVLPPEIRCTQCGAFRWRACGQRGSGPLSVSVGDSSRKLPASTESGSKLILSASEWTKRGDSVSMAERVSRL